MEIVFSHMEYDEGNPLLEHALYNGKISGPFKDFYFRLDGRALSMRVYQDKQTGEWTPLFVYHQEVNELCPVCMKANTSFCSAPDEYKESVFQALKECNTFRLHSLFEL